MRSTPSSSLGTSVVGVTVVAGVVSDGRGVVIVAAVARRDHARRLQRSTTTRRTRSRYGPTLRRMASTATAQRDALIADRTLGGRRLCRALSDATDEMLRRLFAEAAPRIVARRRRAAVTLVAVGGYGRQELAPQSDVDVLLVHDGRPGGIDEVASALWYPLWDAGLKLGHAVRSLDEQLTLAAEDLDTATALLSARTLAGDDELGARLATAGSAQYRRHGRRWLDALRSRVIERRVAAGDVAYLLEPDLKEGHGGLRDIHTLRWAGEADLLVPADDQRALEQCEETLVAVRVALHRATGRAGDVLRLEDQESVAELVRCAVRRRADGGRRGGGPPRRLDRRGRVAPRVAAPGRSRGAGR